MIAEEDIVELIADMSPSPWTVQGKFRAWQLNQLNPHRYRFCQEPLTQSLFRGHVIVVPHHDLGRNVEDTVRNKKNLLFSHLTASDKTVFFILSNETTCDNTYRHTLPFF